MKKYDLVIAGGGFSGLACANSASVRGLNTVVFDKKRPPNLLLRALEFS